MAAAGSSRRGSGDDRGPLENGLEKTDEQLVLSNSLETVVVVMCVSV